VFDSTVAPGGSILYVVDTAKASVSAAAIDGGALTELSTSPFTLPAGAAPFGIVAI
jgi:hypothetical protein